MTIWELVKEIWNDLYSLVGNLLILLAIILSFSILFTVIYLIIIRPIWGTVFSKGKRLYWLACIMIVLFGFVLGPLMIWTLNSYYKENGFWLGAILYLFILYIVSRPFIKKENEKDHIQ